MMELVAEKPEELRFVTDAMPPVVNESGNEVADRRSPKDAELFPEVKERGSLEPLIPGQPGHDDDPDLDGVHDDEAHPPAFRLGQGVARPETFNDEKSKSDGSEQKDHGSTMREIADPTKSIMCL
jgi:hypothetical protein